MVAVVLFRCCRLFSGAAASRFDTHTAPKTPFPPSKNHLESGPDDKSMEGMENRDVLNGGDEAKSMIKHCGQREKNAEAKQGRFCTRLKGPKVSNL